jgi:hypothetical protein
VNQECGSPRAQTQQIGFGKTTHERPFRDYSIAVAQYPRRDSVQNRVRGGAKSSRRSAIWRAQCVVLHFLYVIGGQQSKLQLWRQSLRKCRLAGRRGAGDYDERGQEARSCWPRSAARISIGPRARLNV